MAGTANIAIYDSFEGIRDHWLAFEAEADAYAFQTFDWVSVWHECMGAPAGVRLRLVRVDDVDGRPLMILPLGLERRGGLDAVVWLGGVVTDYEGPLLAPGASDVLTPELFAAVWRHVIGEIGGDIVLLEKQPALIGRQPNPFLAIGWCRPTYTAYFTELSGKPEDFYRARRGGKWLKNERRKQRRLAERGELAYRVADDPDAADAMLTTIIAQKSAWADAMGHDRLLDVDGVAAFYRNLAAQSLANGLVHVSALYCGDAVIAGTWGALHRGRYYDLLSSYDRGFARLSPGGIWLFHNLDWCLTNGVTIYDFSIGDEEYKTEWSEHRMAVYTNVQPLNARGRLFASRMRGRAAVGAVLKRIPGARKAVHRFTAALRAGRRASS